MSNAQMHIISFGSTELARSYAGFCRPFVLWVLVLDRKWKGAFDHDFKESKNERKCMRSIPYWPVNFTSFIRKWKKGSSGLFLYSKLATSCGRCSIFPLWNTLLIWWQAQTVIPKTLSPIFVLCSDAVSQDRNSLIPMMSANNAPVHRRPLTKLAQKYGPFKERDDAAKWPQIARYTKGYKSGLTPVSPYRQTDRRKRKRDKRLMHDWQRKNIGHGLPLDYVRAVRAYVPTCEEDIGGSPWPKVDLGNQIHPLLFNWETIDNFQKDHPPILIGEGYDGYYLVSLKTMFGSNSLLMKLNFLQANNPIIAAALHPSLQLATRLLDNAHTWAWYVSINQSSHTKQLQED